MKRVGEKRAGNRWCAGVAENENNIVSRWQCEQMHSAHCSVHNCKTHTAWQYAQRHIEVFAKMHKCTQCDNASNCTLCDNLHNYHFRENTRNICLLPGKFLGQLAFSAAAKEGRKFFTHQDFGLEPCLNFNITIILVSYPIIQPCHC